MIIPECRDCMHYVKSHMGCGRCSMRDIKHPVRITDERTPYDHNDHQFIRSRPRRCGPVALFFKPKLRGAA